MKKKITLTVRSLVTSVLLLVLLVVGVVYVVVFQLGMLAEDTENSNPNVEKVYEKSNKVIISEIKPRRK